MLYETKQNLCYHASLRLLESYGPAGERYWQEKQVPFIKQSELLKIFGRNKRLTQRFVGSKSQQICNFETEKKCRRQMSTKFFEDWSEAGYVKHDAKKLIL